MSDECRSISDSPCVIHSATALAMPGPSFTHTAAHDHRPRTSCVSPSSGIPSGVSDSRPLIAYFTPTLSSPTISGISSSASSICGSKSACVNGNSVGESDACSIEEISSGSCRIGRCAYEPISRPMPSWRSYMKVSMSRTIGYSMWRVELAKRGTGPMSIIWWTAGVSGISAPAIRAIAGLQTPQATTTISVSMSPRVVRTRRTRPRSTSMPSTSVLAEIVSAPAATARSRMIVPARSESTTPTPGEEKPPSRIVSSMNGTSCLISAGVTIETRSIPQACADDMRRCSSCMRSSVRATSMPPLSVNTSRSWYWRTLSSVSAVISLEWSTGKMKLEACPVEPPGLGNGPLSSSTRSLQPSSDRW